ncbi:MAG: hypothetical protein HUU25_13980 [Candidatus Sumerlaeia bacterium]|nr:hypothetical protein [Candidatus Sumerlaeia bacterium]
MGTVVRSLGDALPRVLGTAFCLVTTTGPAGDPPGGGCCFEDDNIVATYDELIQPKEGQPYIEVRGERGQVHVDGTDCLRNDVVSYRFIGRGGEDADICVDPEHPEHWYYTSETPGIMPVWGGSLPGEPDSLDPWQYFCRPVDITPGIYLLSLSVSDDAPCNADDPDPEAILSIQVFGPVTTTGGGSDTHWYDCNPYWPPPMPDSLSFPYAVAVTGWPCCGLSDAGVSNITVTFSLAPALNVGMSPSVTLRGRFIINGFAGDWGSLGLPEDQGNAKIWDVDLDVDYACDATVALELRFSTILQAAGGTQGGTHCTGHTDPNSPIAVTIQ